MVQHLRWYDKPALDGPVMIVAFEGWNDAGDAASSAVEWLVDRFEGEPFAEIDPEEFFDFTSTRPEVRLEAGERVIDWPENVFYSGTIPTTGDAVILLHGVEPSFRWRTFCDTVIEVARSMNARMVVTLGALLAEVAHSRPVNVVGTAQDPSVLDSLELRRSTYEGPTGIVGVLHAQLAAADIPSCSLWAAVPTYVPGAPSPKATLALVERAAIVLRCGLVTTDLEIAAASYERQINEMVDDDEDTQAYVSALEQQYDESIGVDAEVDAHGLLAEVEKFLRDQNG